MKTTLYTVLCVAIRLGAVFMAAGILERIPGLVVFADQEGHVFLASMLLNGAGLLLAFALWAWPNLLVWWAAGRNSHELLETSITADQLHYVSLSVLGAWMFIGGFAACLAHLSQILMIRREAGSGGYPALLPTNAWLWVIEYALTALAGAALALGARGLVGVLRRLRGYPDVLAESDPDVITTRDG
ncbi:MAG: hypothetical protein ABI128_01135 [Rhodanobacter sp.]